MIDSGHADLEIIAQRGMAGTQHHAERHKRSRLDRGDGGTGPFNLAHDVTGASGDGIGELGRRYHRDTGIAERRYLKRFGCRLTFAAAGVVVTVNQPPAHPGLDDYHCPFGWQPDVLDRQIAAIEEQRVARLTSGNRHLVRLQDSHRVQKARAVCVSDALWCACRA